MLCSSIENKDRKHFLKFDKIREFKKKILYLFEQQRNNNIIKVL